MDPLDDVFAAMHVNSALHSRLRPRAPWGVSFIKSRSIRFGFMLEGQGWLKVNGQPPRRLHHGEGFIARPGVLLSLTDEPQTPTRACEEVFADCAGKSAVFGGEGDPAELLCGWLTFDDSGAQPLLSLLPDCVVIPADAGRSPLLAATLQLLALETDEPHLGSRIVVRRLADVLFMQAIRTHYRQTQPQQGWMAALSDSRLRPVIEKIHQQLAFPWRLSEMAKQAGMSRSAFSTHFRQVTGETPGEYLARWRIWRARCLLRHPNLTLGTIARRVGYDSAITFGRAFKRYEGRTPGEYRRAQSLQLK
ncbi:AraC family transcriptional regulator [Erwiniaceae bacterium CAU 1747]